MIVGNGLIASLFYDVDREDVIFFASGVSNSLETELSEFQREEDLIRETFTQNSDKLFVYFSTCSIYDSSKAASQYVLHKLRMEQIIAENCPKYLILRLSNAVGKGGNPNLLMNYLVRSVRNHQKINVHTKATRNIIDTEDIKNLVLQVINYQNFNKVVNIAYPFNYSIIEILEIIEKELDIEPQLILIKAGSGYEINIPDVENYFKERNLTNKESYLCNILRKYYI